MITWGYLLGAATMSTGTPMLNEEWLVGKVGLTQKRAKRAVKGIGSIGKKTKDGFFVVKAPKNSNAANRLSRAGFTYVFRPASSQIDVARLQSVENHIDYAKARAKLLGYAEGGESGVDFYEALEHYLRPRVDQNGVLPYEVYQAALDHRNQMPPSKAEWFGTPAGSNVPGGNWTFVGPRNLDIPYRTYYGVRSLSGRKNDLAYAPSNPNIIYLASAGGGVWKTVDGGNNWQNASVGFDVEHTTAIAVHPTNPNFVMAGTGDYVGFFTAQTRGIMRSTDGGATWTNVGRSDFGDGVVSRIKFCPEDPNVVIATVGRGSGAQADIWRSTNSGLTWSRTNAPDGNWDDLDIASVAGTSGNRTMWASGGGGNTRLAFSTDRGATWTAATNPTQFSASEPIIDIAASKVSANTVYAIAPNNNKIVRSLDNGATWTDITNNMTDTYNWSQDTYDIHIQTGKNGANDVLYVGLISFWSSSDNGATWVDIARTYQNTALWHNDQHNFTAHPTTDNVGITIGDGGAARVNFNPANNTATFTMLNSTIGDTQHYHLALHPTQYQTRMLAGTQDNATPAARGDLANWDNLYAGDGGYAAYDRTNPAKHYTTSQGGGVYRYDTDNDPSPAGIGVSGGTFVTCIATGGAGYSTLFVTASSKVKRSPGGTGTWTDSVTTFGSTPGNMVVSNRNSNRMWVCDMNGGEVWMSTDGGVNFSNKKGNLPGSRVGDIVEFPGNDFKVLAVLQTTNTGVGRVYRCNDISAASPVWVDVSGTGVTGLPKIPFNAIAIDPADAGTYYAGSDIGMFMTVDGGATWNSMSNLAMPNVHVNNLEVTLDGRFLYAGTFGRGIWRIPLGIPALTAVTANPNRVYGGGYFDLTATLSAPTGTAASVELSDDSALVNTPATLTVPIGSASRTVKLPVGTTATQQTVRITGRYNSVVRVATMTVYPVPRLTNMVFNPSVLYGGNTTTLTATLGSPAPITTYIKMSTTSSNMTLPVNIVIGPGQTVGSVNVPTSVIVQPDNARVIGYVWPNSAQALSRFLNIQPFPALLSVSASPNVIKGGNSTTGSVRIATPAITGGARVTLSDNNTALETPASVTIPAGQSVQSFTLNSIVVATSQNVTVTAQLGSVTRTTLVTVDP
jgi:photosystem II stability/assembly factor-like uncharacterized protein